MFRLFLWELLFFLALSEALDEREYDPKVAPTATKGNRPLHLWPRFLAKLLRTFNPETTAVPRVRKTSSPAPALEFYGALNPIYQTGQF